MMWIFAKPPAELTEQDLQTLIATGVREPCILTLSATCIRGAIRRPVSTTEELEMKVEQLVLQRRHAQELAEQLGQGLMKFLQVGGTAEGETLKLIHAAATCDQCGAPAKYAELVLESYYFCGRHRNAIQRA